MSLCLKLELEYQRMKCLKMLLLLFLSHFVSLLSAQNNTSLIWYPVGVILDMESPTGKMGNMCTSMAISDFYGRYTGYKTRLVLHASDSMGEPLHALYSAVHLLEKEKVQAIIGPQTSDEAELLVKLGEKAKVPIISFSVTSPFLSHSKSPYFVRVATNDNFQVNVIAAIFEAFRWREAILIHEDTVYGNGIIPCLILGLQEINTRVVYRSVILPSTTEDNIVLELYKLMTMSTRVFVVHMCTSLATQFFLKVKEVGMMSEGYAWIVTDGMTSNLYSMESSVIDSMQGVIGIRPYALSSEMLNKFTLKWRKKFYMDNQHNEMDISNINAFCLWAYDAVWALASAAEKVGIMTSQLKNSTSTSFLASISSSHIGSELLKAVSQGKFEGLSGKIELERGQLEPVAFQIVNVAGKGLKGIGFWRKRNGLSQALDLSDNTVYSVPVTRLNTSITWPGTSTTVPKGWKMPVSGKRLKIGVPIKTSFKELVKVEFDPQSNATTVSGFCMEVFRAAVESLPYSVTYDLIPFTSSDGKPGNYNDLIYQVYLQKFDGAAGDMSITSNRTSFVDFTIPYTELGVGMIVPLGTAKIKSMWVFLEPFSLGLWLVSGAFFIMNGCIVWQIERGVKNEFKRPLVQQLRTLLWYSFSILVFAQWDKLMRNLSKFVVMVWLSALLILTSSYTASLSSLLTIHQLQTLPKGGFIGFPNSAVKYLANNNIDLGDAALKKLDSVDDYYKALVQGSAKDGVSAIVDEIPYVKIFLAKYSAGYTMIEQSYESTNGFGFAFPKGSPLAVDISAAIIKLREDGKLHSIEQEWFQNHSNFKNIASPTEPNILNFHSFRGLFLLMGISSTVALIISHLLPKNRSQNHEEPQLDN